MNIDEAREAERVARMAARSIESMAETVAREAAAAAKAAHLEKHGHADALAKLREATAARIAAEDSAPPHPWDGKRVFKTVSVGRRWETKFERIEGIVETRRSQTPFPANTASYNLPEIGDGFVRLLKKDGTPGSKFERLANWKLA